MKKMHDDSNIFFKLELIKHNKTLNVNIHLNPHTQNITNDDQTITWTPTKDEQAFLLEGLQLIKQQEINTTIIFNKKQNINLDSIDKTKIPSDTTGLQPCGNCDDSITEDQWDSIDRIINNKLKIQ